MRCSGRCRRSSVTPSPSPPTRARRRADLHPGAHQEAGAGEGAGSQEDGGALQLLFDTTQGHTQINCCVAKNVYTREAFDTSVTADFKGNFDPVKLEEAILEAGPANVPYIVSTITCNSAGGQPVSIANLKAVYAIARKYDIPVIMGLRPLRRERLLHPAAGPGWLRELDHRGDHQGVPYKYADGLAMSARRMPWCRWGSALLQDDSMLDVYTECRTLAWCRRASRPTAAGRGAMERLAVGLRDGMRQDRLAYRIGQVQYLVDGLEAIGVVLPAGGATRPSSTRASCCRTSRRIGSRPTPWRASSTRWPASGRWR